MHNKGKNNFCELFFIFLICSIIGAYYEQILFLIKQYIKTGNIIWECRSTLIYGTFNIVYGIGAVCLVIFVATKKYKWYETILCSGLLCAIVEYIVHFVQEMFLNIKFWDYKDNLLNIDGRTTIPLIIIWGIFSYLFLKYVYPIITKLIKKVPKNACLVFTIVFLILMILNIFITSLVIRNKTINQKGDSNKNIIYIIVNYYYPNEILLRQFPNAIYIMENN